MNAVLQRLVRQRAKGRCEYCVIAESASRLPFQIDHIVAISHGGATILSNLSYSCLSCNKHKGPNLSGIDPKTKRIVRLFHSPLHKWEYHFRYQGAYVSGRTPYGRATVATLAMNDPMFVAVRQTLIEEGVLPPSAESAD